MKKPANVPVSPQPATLKSKALVAEYSKLSTHTLKEHYFAAKVALYQRVTSKKG